MILANLSNDELKARLAKEVKRAARWTLTGRRYADFIARNSGDPQMKFVMATQRDLGGAPGVVVRIECQKEASFTALELLLKVWGEVDEMWPRSRPLRPGVPVWQDEQGLVWLAFIPVETV